MTHARPLPTAQLRVIRELLTPPAHVLREDATLGDVADAFATDGRSQTAYLTGPGGLLTGVVPFRRLRRAAHLRNKVRFPGLAGLLQRAWVGPVATARDIARPPVGVDLHTPIREALFHMDVQRLTDLPIVDQRGAILLELTHDAHAKLLRDLLAKPIARAIDVRGKNGEPKASNVDKRDQSAADIKVDDHAPIP